MVRRLITLSSLSCSFSSKEGRVCDLCLRLLTSSEVEFFEGKVLNILRRPYTAIQYRLGSLLCWPRRSGSWADGSALPKWNKPLYCSPIAQR